MRPSSHKRTVHRNSFCLREDDVLQHTFTTIYQPETHTNLVVEQHAHATVEEAEAWQMSKGTGLHDSLELRTDLE